MEETELKLFLTETELLVTHTVNRPVLVTPST